MEEYILGLSLGVAMACVNLFKRYLPAAAVPLVSFLLAVILGAMWGAIFGVDIASAVKNVAIGGAIALGLFAGTDAGVNKAVYGEIRPTKAVLKD